MKYIVPALGTIAAVALFATSNFKASPAIAAESSKKVDTFKQLELFADVMARVRSDYVVDVEDNLLIEDAINGMLQSLDPHSSYMNADTFRDMQDVTAGEYGGLGMEVTSDSGFVKVVAPIDNTPASKAGIEAGDYITEIDGESLIGMGLTEAVDQMRGKPGEPITVTIVRKDEDPMEITMVRAIIPQNRATYQIKDGIPVVRISQFNDKTESSMKAAITAARNDLGGKLPGLVLDLRRNPGGLLDQSIKVSSAFLDGGDVVSTRGRRSNDVQEYSAEKGDMLKNVPIVVLIDNASASASEIVAGAIQDRERGLVVGMTSFGKGSVQSIIPLRGGRDGAIRLTTQRYYTPSGRSIQGTGIEPDIFVSAEPEDENARKTFRESDLPNAIKNELEAAEAEKEAEIKIEYPPADFSEDGDFQLDKAIEILKTGTYKTLMAAAG
jgi:carboxyl-terminal processing protease